MKIDIAPPRTLVGIVEWLWYRQERYAWKSRAPLQIQKAVQHTLFPHGLAYDFENGFGTIELNESYLLLQKIASEDANDSSVVAGARFELATSGLWVLRSNQLSYPAALTEVIISY